MPQTPVRIYMYSLVDKVEAALAPVTHASIWVKNHGPVTPHGHLDSNVYQAFLVYLRVRRQVCGLIAALPPDDLYWQARGSYLRRMIREADAAFQRFWGWP